MVTAFFNPPLLKLVIDPSRAALFPDAEGGPVVVEDGGDGADGGGGGGAGADGGGGAGADGGGGGDLAWDPDQAAFLFASSIFVCDLKLRSKFPCVLLLPSPSLPSFKNMDLSST